MCRSDILSVLEEIVESGLTNAKNCKLEETDDRVVFSYWYVGRLKIVEFLSNGRVMEGGQIIPCTQMNVLSRLRSATNK